MNRLAVLARIGALTLVLVAGSRARADLITWDYAWSVSPEVITSDGTSVIRATPGPSSFSTVDARLLAVTLRAFSTATLDKPDHIKNQRLEWALTLTDRASHQSGQVTFSAGINGTLWADALFNYQTEIKQPWVQSLNLGANHFDIAFDGGGAAFGNDNTDPFGIFTTVAAEPASADAPEPATLVLAGAGLFLLGAVGWWRHGRLAIPAR
jgi:hypothetical protein